ncbi:MAG: unnamed protein product [uncultured Paraburkholderia sp.]|nr:MAG: unnamed protein product [uncultured Paraburkholderia sp.]
MDRWFELHQLNEKMSAGTSRSRRQAETGVERLVVMGRRRSVFSAFAFVRWCRVCRLVYGLLGAIGIVGLATAVPLLATILKIGAGAFLMWLAWSIAAEPRESLSTALWN